MGERNNRKTGACWEEKAKVFLEQRGVQIIAQNFRCRIGEIDLIGMDGSTLVFVEVKYRSSQRAGHPAEAVHAAKQRKICRAADVYRMKRRIGEDTPIRYDVVAFTETEICWYQNAFPHYY